MREPLGRWWGHFISWRPDWGGGHCQLPPGQACAMPSVPLPAQVRVLNCHGGEWKPGPCLGTPFGTDSQPCVCSLPSTAHGYKVTAPTSWAGRRCPSAASLPGRRAHLPDVGLGAKLFSHCGSLQSACRRAGGAVAGGHGPGSGGQAPYGQGYTCSKQSLSLASGAISCYV